MVVWGSEKYHRKDSLKGLADTALTKVTHDLLFLVFM